MNPSNPTTSAYLPNVHSTGWAVPMLNSIGQTFPQSQDLRLHPAPSTPPSLSSGLSSNLVTIPLDFHRPNDGSFGVEPFLELGYQRMGVSQLDGRSETVPRAACMASDGQRHRQSQICALGCDCPANHYNVQSNMAAERTTPCITSPRQPNLSVPLVPIYDFKEFDAFYPKSSSPKAAISDVDEMHRDFTDRCPPFFHSPVRSILISDFQAASYRGPSEATLSSANQRREEQFRMADEKHIREQLVIDDHQSLATRYSRPWQEGGGLKHLHRTLHGDSSPDRVSTPYGITPRVIQRHLPHVTQGPSGPSVESLVHRSNHPNIGGRRKPSPYPISGASNASYERTVSPYAGEGGLLVPSYRTQSPTRSPLWSASTPALSTTSSLPSFSPIPRPDGMTEVMAPNTPGQRILADISRRRSSQKEATNQGADTTVSHLHRAATSHRLGVGVTSGQPPGQQGPSTVVPQLLVSPSPLVASSSMPADLARFLSISFQEPVNWWRRLILDNILQAGFLRSDESEPLDKGNADTITMGFGKQGRSIYGVFVEEYTKGKWKCTFGSETTPCPNNAVFKRFERAVEHVRSHLNHRPYKCDGSCNPETRTCQRKFFAHQYLRDHLTRKEKTPCEICGRSVLTQNIPRHNQLRHPS